MGYSSCNYADPKNPVLTGKLWEFVFNADGTIKEQLTFYASGKLESKIIAGGDADGNEYYHYNDDTANSLSHKVLTEAQALITGTRAYYYEYDASGNKTKEEGYSACDYADPKAPALSGRLWTWLYDADGITILEKLTYYFDSQRVESKVIPAGDADGNEYYHFNNNADGTMSHKVLVTAETDGTKAYYYEYDAGTGNKVKEEGYTACNYSNPSAPNFDTATKVWTIIYDAADGTTILEKYTFYASGNMETKIIPAGDSEVPSNEYYQFYDDATNPLKVKVLKTPAVDGTKAHYYEYDADWKKTKEVGYSSCNYADPKNPVLTGKLWEFVFNADGTIKEQLTFYASGKLESKIITGGDADGNEYYHFNDDTANSLSHKVLTEAQALITGTRAYYYEYDAVTGKLAKEEG